MLHQKTEDPRWALEGYHVYPNPLSRFGDTTDPDRPPMPPDDPAAQALSPNPQKPYKKSGVGLVEGVGYLELLDQWDVQNRAEKATKEQAEKERQPPTNGKTNDARPEGMSKAPDDGLTGGAQQPDPEKLRERAEERARRELADAVTVSRTIPDRDAEKRVSQERTFLIKLEQAFELGLINSREYQTRREQVYLAALPVTLERFAFCPQLFAAETAFNERFGRRTPEGFTRRWRLDSTAGFSQLFSTGALLLVSFANRTIFNLTNRPDTSVSTLSLDIIQPLLQGAGRAVTLEPLTQAERNLLYVIRDFAKFRQDFYVFLAGGQPNIPGAVIDPGRILGGSVGTPPAIVPSGAPVVRPLVPALVGPQVTPGDGFRLSPAGVGNAPTQGYLSTVVEKAQLVNQYRNVESLRRYLELFRVYLEGGIVDQVQVNQVEQTLLRAVEDSLRQQANYRSSIDQFKLQLGLPMNLRLEVEDEPLEPMFTQTRRYERISNQYEKLTNEVLQYSKVGEEAQLRGRLRMQLTRSSFVSGTRFPERISKELAEWEKLPPGGKKEAIDVKLDDLTRQRDVLREKREQLKENEKGDLSPTEARQLEELEFRIEVGRFERALRAYQSKFWAAEKDAGRRLALQNQQFTVVYRYFLAILEDAFRERQERARTLWPALPPLCVDGVDLLNDDDDKVLAAVSRAALANRLDLMNQRAQLVDSWRKIRIAANSLLGTFNVQYHFDTTSPATIFRPFALGDGRNRHQLIMDTEVPLVRIAQRNAYRSTLIAYQQQRRQLQLAEDQVLFDVRSALRQLRATANSYHNVQKRQVELAYVQVDQSLQAFSQPQQPAGPPSPAGAVGPPSGGRGGGDPAALTQQLLGAQNSLLGAQNNLYNTWIAYLITRMSLYRDMGLMQLDPRGVWIDDVATCHCPPAGDLPADRETDKRSPERSYSDELPVPSPVPAAKK